MPNKRFSDEQVKAILAENQAGKAASTLCKEHNVSATTFYKWKDKFDPEYRAKREARAEARATPKQKAPKETYGGLSSAERAELEKFRSENVCLKMMLADAFMGGFRPNELIEARASNGHH